MTSTAEETTDFMDVPDGLQARCQRVHGWNQAFAEKAIVGYCQFMKLKRNLEDYNAAILSPSLTIDLVWHQHLLDNRHYNEACLKYAGQVIYHNPDGALDPGARKARVKTTQTSLKALFGRVFDPQVWSFGDIKEECVQNNNSDDDGATTTKNSNAKKRSRETTESEEKKEEEGVKDFIHLVLRTMNGETTDYKIKPNLQMMVLFRKFAHSKGVDEKDFAFLLDGERIPPGMTANQLELADGDLIHALLVQSGC